MDLRKPLRGAVTLAAASYLVIGIAHALTRTPTLGPAGTSSSGGFDAAVQQHADQSLDEGRQTFRFDTFGDQAFWGGVLQLHQAIEGASLGGVGPGVSPRTALAVGLKVDSDALPNQLISQLRRGAVNLDDPATTLALLKLNAVVGVTGIFGNDGHLSSIGIQCALCHSTVDNAVAPGIGHRLDGFANRDLDVGHIISLAPNLQPVANLLGTDVNTVRTVLDSWGPGKFDAELFLDGKAFAPSGRSGATLIPPAFGLAGVNLHTWEGWGSVTYWNAFVANLEMHGKGTFFDPRLDNAAQFPIAAANGFGHVAADSDLITEKLPALHFYQLALPAPAAPPGTFDTEAAERGDELFSGKAKCASCHTDGLWSEPGWNLHTPDEVGVDAFQADRGPEHRYRTSPLKGIWTHQKGGFYHDGRFPTLDAVVAHYDSLFHLGLTDQERSDIVQYMLALSDFGEFATSTVTGLPPTGVTARAAMRPAPEGAVRVWPAPGASSAATHIAFAAAHGVPSDLEIGVFDVTGRRIASPSHDRASVFGGVAGVVWDGRDASGRTVGPGVYFVRVRAASTGLAGEARIIVK